MNYHATIRTSKTSEASLVLLHGLGSDEQDMLGLAELIDSRIEVICLRAPHTYGPGYAWFNIEWTQGGIKVDEDEYWDAVGNLAHAIKVLNRPRTFLGGFSQGAMMSIGAISRFPQVAEAGILLSGRGIKHPCSGFEGKIFQGHGIFDEVIPISEARDLNAELKPLGKNYEYHEYEIGHGINEEEMADLNLFFEKVLELK